METGGRFAGRWKVLLMVALMTAGMGGALDAEATNCALEITDWEEYCCVEKVDEWSGTVKCTLSGDAKQENIDEDLETVWDVGNPFTNEAESESGDETELYLDLGLESGTTNGEYTADVEFSAEYDGDTVCEKSISVTATVFKVEFDNTWVRNLAPLDTGADLAKYTNCIAVECDDSGELDLEDEDYLKIVPDDLTWDDIKDVASIEIGKEFFGNASTTGAVLEYGDTEPGRDIHDIYGFGVESKCDAAVMDRLVVVIYKSEMSECYDDWVERYDADPAWVDDLPLVYSRLGGDDGMSDPEPDNCENDEWRNEVEHLDNNYHYDAEDQMRSHSTGLLGSGHGHQACYDSGGHLNSPNGTMEALAACGTADFEFSRDAFGSSHVSEDVWPFVHAAQLDGNPVEGEGGLGPARLSDTLIRIGDNLEDYFDRRPPHTDDMVESGVCIE